MIDASQPQSPGWWLNRLSTRLRLQLAGMNLLESYYIGEHPLPRGDRDRARIYRDFQRRARSNYTGLVVESVKERLHVDGFRAGGTATDTQDKDAWRIWQANSLDSDSGMVHQQALTMGRSYVIVGADPQAKDSDPGTPVITAEDPRQVIHEASPVNRRRLLAALKIYDDELAGNQAAVLYLPDDIWYFKGPRIGTGTSWTAGIDPRAWYFDTTDDTPDGSASNPLGVVPVVPFYNRPRLRPNGYKTMGEFEDVTDVQDRINGDTLDRLVIARMQAYRQRFVSGMEVEKDSAGQPIRPFDPDVTSLWIATDHETKFGDFSESDLKGILEATSGDVTHLAAITRTPPQYLLGQMANLSGDALEAAQSGLISKVQERQLHYGESWEQTMRLASMYTRGPDVPPDAEVVWADPTQRSLVDLSQAGVALQTAGVPWRTRMEWMGFSPTDIERMAAEQIQDALRARMLTPVPSIVTETVKADATGPPAPAPTGPAPTGQEG